VTSRAATAVVLLALLLAACDGFSSLPPPDPVAEKAWLDYRAAPTTAGYMYFIRENGKAAARNADPHDAVGIRYQVRALEVQAAEAERVADGELAVLVTDRVDEIEAGDLLEFYEERLPGSRDRMVAARDRAAAVLRQR
jgi:hypothetical protein